jgi:hypothetical protein
MRQGHGALLLLLLLAAGCGDVPQLIALRSGLSREFREAGVGVGLTDRLILTVTLVNGPWADATCESQAALALRVAGYVRDNYQDFDSLQTVSVAFQRRRSFGPVATTSTRLPFRFTRTTLQAGLLAADSADAVALCRDDIGRPDPPPTRRQ